LDPAAILDTISPETQKILGACAIALGAIYCFFGYRFFKVALFSTGFMSFSVAATYVSYLLAPKNDMPAVIASAIGGIAGGFLFLFVYIIGVFAFGASFGALVGTALTAVAGREIQPILIGILGITGGALALLLQRHIVILATSFGGAGGMISGAWYLWKGIDPVSAIQDPAAIGREFQAMVASWLIASILGVVMQYGVTGKPRKEEEEEAEDVVEVVEDEPKARPETERRAKAEKEPREALEEEPEEEPEAVDETDELDVETDAEAEIETDKLDFDLDFGPPEKETPPEKEPPPKKPYEGKPGE
jgi:hypothetical protein